MNAELLLQHFERLSEAPDAIPRLRRFILDLAVRGKLVEQDSNDEPASELLKRIQAEKARLVKAGSARKEKPGLQLIVDDMPFPVPQGWRWSQLAEIGFISPRNDAAGAALASFVPMTLIPAEYGIPHKHEVRPWSEFKTGYTHFAEGDVGLAKITPCFENGKSTVFRGLTGGYGAGTTELHIVRPLLINADYILVFLKSSHFIETGIPRMTGTAGQKRVPADYFAYSPFPLPPLAEQHRIVAKVDELMALCGQLEAAKIEREQSRDRLVACSLQQLNQPADDEEAFRKDARFTFNHLPRLTTRLAHIKQLRQTILNLAVRGKLVPQNRSDIPVQLPVLRAASAASGMDDEVFQKFRDSIPLPNGWQIAPLLQIAANIVDCPHTTPIWTEQGEICVRTNQLRPRRLDLSAPRFVSRETYLQRIERLEPQAGDILYSREGGILGISCQVPAGVRLCLGQRLMLIRAGSQISSNYLDVVLNSPFITGIAMSQTTGGAAPRVNMATVRGYPIPIPPLAEQHRIVTRVDELMAICDQLESQLATTEVDSSRFLEAVLQEAMTPVLEKAA